MPAILGPWDILLVVIVAVMATTVSYVHAPKLKALFLSFPVPFTVAALALGQPVGLSHVLGLATMWAYVTAIRWMHVNAKLPIVPAIALATAGYCGTGATLAKVAPDHPAAFWIGSAALFLVGLAQYSRMPHHVEPGHRSPMPVPAKLAAVTLLVLGLVAVKNQLQGFMTCFPMVGTFVMYEARHSLRTCGRQLPVAILCMMPMLAVIYVLQESIGLGAALAAGWPVLLATLVPLTRHMWRRQERALGAPIARPEAAASG